MNAPRENIDGRGPLAGKAAKALAFAGALTAFEAQAATVVDQSFGGAITEVSDMAGVNETFASSPDGGGMVLFKGTRLDDGSASTYEKFGAGAPYQVVLPRTYSYFCPLDDDGTEFLGSRTDRSGADFLRRDALTGEWSVQSEWVSPSLHDSHIGCERTATAGDVFVYLNLDPQPDELILNIGGVERVLAEVPYEVSHATLDYANRTVYVASEDDIVKYTWVDGAPTTPVAAWAAVTTPVVLDAWGPSYKDGVLHFAATGLNDNAVYSIQKLPEVAPELPIVEPASVRGQDGTDLLASSAEVNCTEAPTYTFEVALPEGAVVSSENLFLIEGDVSTPLVGRLVDGKLAVDVPTVGMPPGLPCRVTGIAVGEDVQALFEVTLVATPSCDVSLEDQEVVRLDVAPETGEVVIGGEAGTLAYTVDFLALFADGQVTADVKGAGSIVYGVDETGRSFLRTSDGIARFLSGTEAAMVKFAPTEGSVTIFGADGRVLTTLNAGEIAVVSIDYVTPEEGEHPGTKTEDPEAEDPKNSGCDTSGKTPNGVAAGVLAAVMGVLRRRKKN